MKFMDIPQEIQKDWEVFKKGIDEKNLSFVLIGLHQLDRSINNLPEEKQKIIKLKIKKEMKNTEMGKLLYEHIQNRSIRPKYNKLLEYVGEHHG